MLLHNSMLPITMENVTMLVLCSVLMPMVHLALKTMNGVLVKEYQQV